MLLKEKPENQAGKADIMSSFFDKFDEMFDNSFDKINAFMFMNWEKSQFVILAVFVFLCVVWILYRFNEKVDDRNNERDNIELEK